MLKTTDGSLVTTIFPVVYLKVQVAIAAACVLVSGCSEEGATTPADSGPVVTVAAMPDAGAEGGTVDSERDSRLAPTTTPPASHRPSSIETTATPGSVPLTAAAPTLPIAEAIPAVIGAADLTGYVTIDEAQNIADSACTQLEPDPEMDQYEFEYVLYGVIGNMTDDPATSGSAVLARLGGDTPWRQLFVLTGLLITHACPWNNPTAEETVGRTWPASMQDQGLALAQELADAFADEDWSAVRRISPTNPYSDAELAEGYAGLDAVTLFLGGTRSDDSDTVDLYLLQVAHETRPAGLQTSLYCVRWNYHITKTTISQETGELIRTDHGHTPPSDAERGAAICDGFDVDPAPTPRPIPAGPRIDDRPTVELPYGWFLLGSAWGELICRPSPDVLDDYDCERFRGGPIPTIIGHAAYKCSNIDGSYECTDEGYHPSELVGYEITAMGKDTVLCKTNRCWIWQRWESPSMATLRAHVYECEFGNCRRV
jgi:hypothetical protein